MYRKLSTSRIESIISYTIKQKGYSEYPNSLFQMLSLSCSNKYLSYMQRSVCFTVHTNSYFRKARI